MADAAHLDIPPAQVSSQTAKCTLSKESTLQQVNETEPSEQVHHIESKISMDVERGLGTAVFSNVSEQLQPFSENVACLELTTSEHQPRCEKTHEFESGHVCNESPEQHQPGSEYVRNESVQGIAAVGSCHVNKHLDSFYGNKTDNFLTKELELPPEDASTSSQAGKTSCLQQVTSEQKHECGVGNQCSGPSEQKHHVDSNHLLNEMGKTNRAVSSFIVTEQCESVSENRSLISGKKLAASSEDVIKNCQAEKSSCPQQSTSRQAKDFGCGCLLGETPKQEDHLDSGLVQNVPVETSNAASDFIATQHLGLSLQASSKQPEQPSEDVIKRSSLEQFETSFNGLINKSSQLGRRDKRTSKSRKKKYMLRSLVGTDRVLRSRTQEKPKSLESSNNSANDDNGVEKKRRGRKRKIGKQVIADEFSRIRTRLRYFLNRIHYEQNLIDAYSSEGWKGNSLEKLKPEKELQRATSEIFRRKLKIRDLFQQLDSLCAEGRFPKSLFDSEGQIDSEDIFCAKCGSKDLSADNDIILCDGACDRGFHQFCLEPPLLSEDIPPDDEGWLCPGCDCKVDCVDLLNDSQGTNLSVGDSWEKVFPEAAAAAREGTSQDHNPEFPSDDSDDDDYDPDGTGTEEKIEGDKSSSDDSEYASACDELEAQPNDERHLGLSSDDSEDNDYDPNALDIDENSNQESSSSDFTSDSEDLAATLDDEKSSEKDEVHMSSSSGVKRLLGKSDRQSFKHDGNKSSLKDELLDILDSSPGRDSSPVLGKRHVERLDYKRLHDETYGNVPSDSSDDEDWNGSAAPRKRKKTTGQVTPASLYGNASTINNENTMEAINHDVQDNEHVSRRRTRRKSMVKDTNNSPSKSVGDSPKSGSTGGRVKSTYRKLGEAATQRLYKSFKENHYPDRAMKQSLAQELGLTSQQVSKWFENMRWSSRHSSSSKVVGASETASKGSDLLPYTNKKPLNSQQNTDARNSTSNGAQDAELPGTVGAMPGSCSGDVGDGKATVLTRESSGQNSTTPTSRKRRGRPRVEKPETPAALVDTQETSGKKTRRRRKSAL